jgi:hypothetical protein
VGEVSRRCGVGSGGQYRVVRSGLDSKGDLKEGGEEGKNIQFIVNGIINLQQTNTKTTISCM